MNTKNIKQNSNISTESSSDQNSPFKIPSTKFSSNDTPESSSYSTSKQRSTSINNLSRNVLKNYSYIAASVYSSLTPTNTLFIKQNLNSPSCEEQRQKVNQLKNSDSIKQINSSFFGSVSSDSEENFSFKVNSF